MSTTTIRLPDELTARIASAAQRAGVTPYNFILQALNGEVEQEERRTELDAMAENRYARILATGQTIPWQEMRSYLLQRATGIPVTK
jgi:predicted transcriptional regulator